MVTCGGVLQSGGRAVLQQRSLCDWDAEIRIPM